LQSVFGFLSGIAPEEEAEGATQQGKGQQDEKSRAQGEPAVVDDEPEPPVEDPVAEFEEEAIAAALKAEEAVMEVRSRVSLIVSLRVGSLSVQMLERMQEMAVSAWAAEVVCIPMSAGRTQAAARRG
jgi:hypothetical protein